MQSPIAGASPHRHILAQLRDGHAFHFFGGRPVKDDGSLALYTIVEQEDYLTDTAVEAEKAGVAQG